MKAHSRRVSGTCYSHLRRLQARWRSYSSSTVSAFALSRLNYSYWATLACQCRLWRRCNVSCILLFITFGAKWSPFSVNKLLIKQGTDFKLCLLVHQTVNGRAPSSLQDLITLSVSVPRRAILRSASHHDLVLWLSHCKFAHFLLLVPLPGILFLFLLQFCHAVCDWIMKHWEWL